MLVENKYYILGGILICLAIILLVLAIRDILLTRRNKMMVFLLILAPIIGPLIYFQSKRGK